MGNQMEQVSLMECIRKFLLNYKLIKKLVQYKDDVDKLWIK